MEIAIYSVRCTLNVQGCVVVVWFACDVWRVFLHLQGKLVSQEEKEQLIKNAATSGKKYLICV